MTKQFIKAPKTGREKIFFFLGLAKGISGNPVNKEEVIKLFDKEEIELTDDLMKEIVERFPEVEF